MSKFEIALLERPGEQGLTKDEIMRLTACIDYDEMYPIEVEAREHESSAMGFIARTAAEQLDFDYDELSVKIARILDDMALESSDGVYVIPMENLMVRVLLTRNIQKMNSFEAYRKPEEEKE